MSTLYRPEHRSVEGENTIVAHSGGKVYMSERGTRPGKAGVINVLWLAAITIFVFMEKVLTVGPWVDRVGGLAGIGVIVSGVGVLVIE